MLYFLELDKKSDNLLMNLWIVNRKWAKKMNLVVWVKEAGEEQLKRNLEFYLQHSKKFMIVASRSGTFILDPEVIFVAQRKASKKPEEI